MELHLSLRGIGVWTPGWPDWPSLRARLRGEAVPQAVPPARPAATLLPAAERRRAPDTVLLAAQAAAEACAMAGCDAAELPSVFASSQGDVAITDAMCDTLARAPQELSPTKFHNSVHNAPAGYWTIATHCHRPSTALSAREHTVGAGLLEVALQCLDGNTPVLLACYDSDARGTALAQVVPHTCGFAAAFVLAPGGAGSAARLVLRRAAAGSAATPWPAATLPAALASNPSAAALVLLQALAAGGSRVHLPAAPGMMLDIQTSD